jgi:filamentous hemagglutinin family protein
MKPQFDYSSIFKIKAHGIVSLVVSGMISGVTAVTILGSSAYAAPANNTLPTNPNIKTGQVNISAAASNTLNISQASNKSIINWDSFSIGKDATVNYNFANKGSSSLNRVVQNNPSEIFGKLNANGQVVLVNPNGILFGNGSSVNVSSLVASVMDIKDSDYMDGKLTFSRDSAIGKILNEGTLTAQDKGFIALLAPEVVNNGVIKATMGTISLAAGDKVELTLDDRGLKTVIVEPSTIQTLIENKGLISADGGLVYMGAKQAAKLLDDVMNLRNSGIVEANSAGDIFGKVTLDGDRIEVSGTIQAKGGEVRVGNQNNDLTVIKGTAVLEGEFVETSGHKLVVEDGVKIKAKEWLLDPYDVVIDDTGSDATAGTNTASSDTTHIKASAIATALGSGHVTITTGNGGTQGGDITVNSTIDWHNQGFDQGADGYRGGTLTLNAYRNIYINSPIIAWSDSGSGGKLVLKYGQGSTDGVINGEKATYLINNYVRLDAYDSYYDRRGELGVRPSFAGNNLTVQFGSAGTPIQYTIYRMASELYAAMNAHKDGNFAITQSNVLDFSDGTFGVSNFSPIGTDSSAPFTGRIEGLGSTISGISTDIVSGDYAGFIGYARGAEIRNLKLEVSSVKGANYVGGLAGYFENGLISNVGVNILSYDSAFSEGSSKVGGIVGELKNSTLTNSYADISYLYGVSQVGGLVGHAVDSTILNSYTAGNVGASYLQAGSSIGGLIGEVTNSTIKNTYSTAHITLTDTAGNSNIGFLIGKINSGSVSKSYTYGNSFDVYDSSVTDSTDSKDGYNRAHWLDIDSRDVTNTITNRSAFIGNKAGGVTTSDNYWLNGTSNVATTGATSRTDVEFMTPSTFANWDMTLWTFAGGGSSSSGYGITNRPYIAHVMNVDQDMPQQTTLFASGYGTSVSPYLISSATQLQNMNNSNIVGTSYYYKLNRDVSLSGVTWTPIGSLSSPFIGNFNGDSGSNRTISNLSITGSSNSSLGLFGYTQGASISNLFLSNISISSSGDYIGGLVGKADNTQISGSHTSGTVTSRGGGLVGGLVGYAYNNTQITDSYSAATVSGYNAIGGLVGYAKDSDISNSYATGSVTGADVQVGGLIGLAEYTTTGHTLTRNYATGNVSGKTGTGGLIGSLYGNDTYTATHVTVSQSYATGNITDIGGEASAGLIGEVWNVKAAINDVYATGNVSGADATNHGGLIAYLNTNSTVSNSYSTGSVKKTDNSANGGGLIGYNEDSTNANVTNSYWDTTTSGLATSAGGTSKTTAELKNFGTFSGWNNLVVDGSQNNVYPQLRWSKTGLSAGTSVWVIGKGNVTYTVAGGTTTYGTAFTLPTPTFAGGTPTGTVTVKVYNGNTDVTTAATNGTLAAGTYTVKTLLTDTNYQVASTGNTAGTLTITAAPTEAPTSAPTSAPTQAPTSAPTDAPTQAPTSAPTAAPTDAPTQAPTVAPTSAPTSAPTVAPTQAPTSAPISAPTVAPTQAPTSAPTVVPTQAPTQAPTAAPTSAPISAPTVAPTQAPTAAPHTETVVSKIADNVMANIDKVATPTNVTVQQNIPSAVQIVNPAAPTNIIPTVSAANPTGSSMANIGGATQITQVVQSAANPFSGNDRITVLDGGVKVASAELPSPAATVPVAIAPTAAAPVTSDTAKPDAAKPSAIESAPATAPAPVVTTLKPQRGVELTMSAPTGGGESKIVAKVTDSGSGFSFAVKEAVNINVAQKDIKEVKATLDGGQALPSWLKFDAATQTFQAINPPSNALPISTTVSVTAKSGQTQQISVEITK